MKDKHEKRNTGSQCKQFIVGSYAAIRYVITSGRNPVPPSEDKKYEPKNRQKFHDKLEALEKKKSVIASKHAQYELNMMKGQNNAQTQSGQPMPKKTIDLFLKQVNKHAKLDKEARKAGKTAASEVEHQDINIKSHKELSQAFGNSGYVSGKILHKIGIFQSMIIQDMANTNEESQCRNNSIFE